MFKLKKLSYQIKYNNYIKSNPATGKVYKLRLVLAFDENIDNGEFITRITGTTFDPKVNFEYNLVKDRNEDADKMSISISQFVERDLFGWDYKYICHKDNFMILESFDQVNHVVSGKGKFKFKRTNKNGAPGSEGMDKVIDVEIAFYVHYEIK